MWIYDLKVVLIYDMYFNDDEEGLFPLISDGVFTKWDNFKTTTMYYIDHQKRLIEYDHFDYFENVHEDVLAMRKLD